ncbi:MAG TPA: hypothetical protein VHX88_10840 [Solirubrobacteraceae bacterium]|nr:hypothetical protein [Solirubrobacteraceae bacterium]
MLAEGLAAASLALAAQSPQGAQLSASATPASITLYGATTIAGTITDVTAGTPLELEQDPWPYSGFGTALQRTAGPSGSFAFTGLRPGVDTRYEVRAPAAGLTSAPVSVTVNDPLYQHTYTLAHGEVQVTAIVDHSRTYDWAGQTAYWFTKPAAGGHFSLVARTRTRDLATGRTYLTASFFPPAGGYRYLVCFAAPGTAGAGPPSTTPPCPGGVVPAGAFAISGAGVGHPQPPVPSAAGVAAATTFIDSREGRSAFATVNDRGQLEGMRIHEQFHSASLIKAMLLVAYLQELAEDHEGLTATAQSLLYPMIHISDNDAASAVFAIVGEGGLERVAHEVGMDDFEPNAAWGLSLISAGDQARFFYVQDSLIPAQFVGYARSLLSTIDPSQSWGIPAAARPLGFSVFFKGGWLPDEGLVNQAARLERGGERLSIAVLTSDGPGMGYGEDTLAGVTSRLLSG